MRNLLLVGAGGFVGAVARYLLIGWISRRTGPGAFGVAGLFPWGTVAVNVLGCFAIGLLSGLAEHRGLLTAELRLFLVIGLLGGFTTYSPFGYESLALLEGGAGGLGRALLYVGLHLVMGLAAVWAGLALVRGT